MMRFGIKLTLVLAGLFFLILLVSRTAENPWKKLFPDPEVIVTGSLDALKAQNRLSTFAASYVATGTTIIRRFGMSARMTTVIPGSVRYEVDMTRLKDEDVTWDPSTKTISVVLPRLEVVGPQIEVDRIQRYDDGGVLIRLGDVRARLEKSNLTKARAELLRQARVATVLGLAKDATRNAVTQNFALPLRAVGLNAAVRIRFADEPDFPAVDTQQMDRSRSLQNIYGQ